MDDDDGLIHAFLNGATNGRGSSLYVEGDALYLHGWWQAAFRLADDVYLANGEPPPDDTAVMDQLADALRRSGLEEIPGEHPLAQAVTYAELSVAGLEWVLWARDAQRGEAALADRVAPGSKPEGWAPSVWDDPASGDLSAEFAKSLVAGMPPSVVLAVGLDDDVVGELQAVLPSCRVEARPQQEAIAACGFIVPHLAIVAASTTEARQFLLEFRAEACGRHVPVVALTDDEVPPGADVALDPRQSPAAWKDQLLELLP